MPESPLLDVQRSASATGWWEMATRPPSAALSSMVTRMCGYQERAAARVERTERASTGVTVIVSFGDQIEVSLAAGCSPRRFGSFVAGLQPGPAVTGFAAAQHGIQIDLTPLGAFRLLGVPGHTLAGDVIDLDRVDARLGGSFPDRLASAPTWTDRFALIDTVLLGAAADGPEPDATVAWAWRQMTRTRGQIRIAELVAESGWSHRRFTTRFAAEIGVGPKTAARLVRFERAARLVASATTPLADVAARCGYADQSHLTREFRRLAGSTPTNLAPYLGG